MKLILIYLCLLLLQPPVVAIDTLSLSSPFTRVDLYPFSGLYIDSTGEEQLEDIVKHREDFRSEYSKIQDVKYPTSCWLRISLMSKEEIDEVNLVSPGTREGDFVENPVDQMEVYLVNGNRKVTFAGQSGLYVPKRHNSSHAVPGITYVPISLKEDVYYDLFVRIRTMEYPRMTFLGLELRDIRSGLPGYDTHNHWLVIGPWGMFVIIGLFVLILYYYVRDQAYLYFGICCLFYSLDLFGLFPGAGGLYRIFADHPRLVPIIWHSHFFVIPFMYLFGNAYANLDQHFPRWFPYYRLLTIACFLFVFYYLIRNLWLPNTTTHPLIFLSFFLFLPFGFRFLFSKVTNAQIFALGFLIFFLGNLVGVFFLWMGKDWFLWCWISGQLGLLIIYAVSLGHRLLQSQREQAEAEKIKELDQMKNRFFSNISHEFRTPLSLILGPLQKSIEQIPQTEIEEGRDTIPVAIRSIEVMRRNANRLKQLIEQILDLSKIDSAKMRLVLQEGPVLQFVKSRVAEFESLAKLHKIHLITVYGLERENAWFDADKLEKILTNILSNAIKFTPSHGRVQISATCEKENLLVTISDTGTGMTKQHLESLFERFYQVNYDQRGSGIGMALVKELIELHQGQISVESQHNRGTTISWSIGINRDIFPEELLAVDFDLPAEKYLVDIPAKNKEINSELSGGASGENSSLVLIVEDHRDMQEFIAEILREKHQILIAGDGEEGQKLAREHLPDLIISDIMMSGISGTDLCRNLKNEEKTSHIPIILLTAKSDRSDIISGLEKGADDYLTKPFDPEQLILKVQNQINSRRRLREKYRRSPWSLEEVTADSLDERFLRQVQEVIQENMDNEYYSVEDLGHMIGYSRSQLFRKLKALTGKSPLEWIRLHRLHHARALLEKKTMTVSEAAYQVGYSNLSHFSKSFKKEFGISPGDVG